MRNNKIDVFLLAAGESSRMFPLSTIMEKSLLPVNGRPVIRHIIENLTVPEVAKHIRKITICCLTKFKKQFEHEFRDMPSIEFKEFDEPMGTYTTWFFAGENNSTEWSMVHYADLITEIDYNYFFNIQRLNNCDDVKCDGCYEGVIACTHNVRHDYSEVITDTNVPYCTEPLTVKAFHEKPYIENFTWSGIGIFNTKKTMSYYKYKNMDFAFDVFPEMVKKNRLKAYCYSGNWFDMGNLNSYRKVCSMYDKV
jgi:NDP-sugar pyrophosphorylase family protein